MKICHIIYIPRLSGAEMLVVNLALSHISQMHQVSVLSLLPLEISFTDEVNRLQDTGVIALFPKTRLGKLGRLAFLCRQLRSLTPDVIVCHSVVPSAYGRLALKLMGRSDTSTVTVLHDASQDDYASKYWRSLEKWALPSPDYVIALTETAKNNYRKRIGDRAKIEIIPNGINLQHFNSLNPDINNIKRSLFLCHSKEKVLLQIGRFGSTKQQHLSIAAFICTCQKTNYLLPAKLVLVGLIEEETYYENLKKMVADSGLTDKIIFLGPCNNVPELLRTADVYLMPSKREAYSIAFLEALASGIPIIAADISAFEYGRNFSGVTLLKPDNIKLFSEEIFRLINMSSPQRWTRNMLDFSIEKTSDAYLKLFHRLINNQC